MALESSCLAGEANIYNYLSMQLSGGVDQLDLRPPTSEVVENDLVLNSIDGGDSSTSTEEALQYSIDSIPKQSASDYQRNRQPLADERHLARIYRLIATVVQQTATQRSLRRRSSGWTNSCPPEGGIPVCCT